MNAEIYDAVGGEATFRRLVTAFYARVAVDPVLRPLYPEADLGPATERLTLFLIQYWGGPSTYSDARGHPRLRMRHAGFHIGEREREAWLANMLASLDELALAPQYDAVIRSYLTSAALSLQNQV